MRYYLGLDNGGSVSKAALYDAAGKEIYVASEKTRMFAPRAGFTERDMEELWNTDCRLIKKVLMESAVGKENIKGIALSGHGKGLYLWGKDGKPVRNGIISTDRRALHQVLELRKTGVEKEIFRLSGQHLLPCQPSMLLKWLKENEPESIDRIKWVFGCKDYVRFRMTDVAAVERTESSGYVLVNIHTGEYDDRLFKLLDLEDMREKMPRIVESTDICGYVTRQAAEQCGLAEGTPVAGGMADIFACGIAANQVSEREIVMIAGTWSIQQLVRTEPIMDGRVLLNSFYVLPGTYLIEESSPASAGNLEWFLNHFMPEYKERYGVEKMYERINEAVKKISPDEFCPIFLPFILGSNVHPEAEGSFIGIDASHTRGHLIRGIYEGVVFSHKYHCEKLEVVMQEKPCSLILEGGASKSEVWVHIFADVMQLPVKVLEASEAGTLGCAMTAAAAAGEYENLQAASVGMCRIAREILPDEKNFEAYQKKYELYKACIDALDPIWNRVNKLLTD